MARGWISTTAVPFRTCSSRPCWARPLRSTEMGSKRGRSATSMIWSRVIVRLLHSDEHLPVNIGNPDGDDLDWSSRRKSTRSLAIGAASPLCRRREAIVIRRGGSPTFVAPVRHSIGSRRFSLEDGLRLDHSVFQAATGPGMIAVLRNPLERGRFLKFMVVGAIGAVIDFGIANVLTHFLRMDLVPAGTISLACAIVSNFIWNRYWTYPEFAFTCPGAPAGDVQRR